MPRQAVFPTPMAIRYFSFQSREKWCVKMDSSFNTFTLFCFFQGARKVGNQFIEFQMIRHSDGNGAWQRVCLKGEGRKLLRWAIYWPGSVPDDIYFHFSNFTQGVGERGCENWFLIKLYKLMTMERDVVFFRRIRIQRGIGQLEARNKISAPPAATLILDNETFIPYGFGPVVVVTTIFSLPGLNPLIWSLWTLSTSDAGIAN